jgi:CRP/FNR family transcriptional regulator, cyclic AMP receptor protein
MNWSILDSLVPTDRQALIASARRRRFAKGEVVFHEGDVGDSLHLIVGGRVGVQVSTPLGDTTLIRIIGAGGWFGELSMISPGERNATMVALEPLETLVVTRDDAAELRRRVPEFEARLVGALVEEIRRITTFLLAALYIPVDKRLYRRLVELDSIYRAPDGRTRIPLTQDEIAQLVGTTRPTVNKHLREAVSAGWITMQRCMIEIVDVGALDRKAR